ncbi:MAG: hypothetical protein ACRD1R_16310 [Acidobacteriota bacterium]
MREDNLNSFLKLGYFLDYQSDFHLDLSNLSKDRYAGWTETDLVEHGADLVRRIFAARFVPGKDIVVPVSGGLDSRAILAGLIELTSPQNINTCTFGTPGTFDYELGNRVCRASGTRHVAFPLTEYRYTLAELIDISRRIDHQTFLFHHPPVHEADRRFQGATVWSGFIGDFFVGSHLPQCPAPNLREAKSRFFEENRFVRSLDLSSLPDEALFHLIEYSGRASDTLNVEEVLLIENRLGKNTAPHVLIRGHDYVTPFTDQAWIDFTFSLPDRYRRGMYLWRRILPRAFPYLFSIGVKNNWGLPLNAGLAARLSRRAWIRARRRASRQFRRPWNPYLNYIDFDAGIRERDDLRELVSKNVRELLQRGLVSWIDAEKIWQDHMSGRGNHADALVVLASLEIHLKAGVS